jgi:hypothetical protein
MYFFCFLSTQFAHQNDSKKKLCKFKNPILNFFFSKSKEQFINLY